MTEQITEHPDPGEIKVDPDGNVVIGAPTAVAEVVIPKDDGEVVSD